MYMLFCLDYEYYIHNTSRLLLGGKESNESSEMKDIISNPKQLC